MTPPPAPAFPKTLGERMHARIAELQPYVRSITGPGTQRTLEAIATEIPMRIESVPSGTPVLDWTVPPEWLLREAYVVAPSGQRVVDVAEHPLRVMSYSVPVNERMSLTDLLPHLHSLPDRPHTIPYRTSYYREDWGFCLRQAEVDSLADGMYEVFIDSELEAAGVLNYGEAFFPGESSEEVLISCHVCHPWGANDNLSGISVAVEVAQAVAKRLDRRYSYRFLFVPGTIGSITWLARNEANISRIVHGLVLAGVGAAGPFTYKRSRRGNATIDRAFAQVLKDPEAPHSIIDFEPYGYDERQYCSPGFNLPVGCLMRAKHGAYPEYHTSDDDLDFVTPDSLAESAELVLRVIDVLETNRRYVNLSPKGEPQLGRRGLYRALGGLPNAGEAELAMLWVLSYSDGERDLLDIASRSGLSFLAVHAAAEGLKRHELIADTSVGCRSN
jgi:aminopeptidase-like protein